MFPELPLPLPSWWAALSACAVGLLAFFLGRARSFATPQAFSLALFCAVGLTLLLVLSGLAEWVSLLRIPMHGLLIGLGLLLAYHWWLRRLPAEVDHRSTLFMAMSALLLALLGARLWFLAEFWPSLDRSWLSLIDVQGGGLVLYGGVLGGLLGLWIAAHHQGVPLLTVTDAAAVPALVALAIGRVGCLLNGCCYGAPCSLPWALPSGRSWQVALQDGQLRLLETTAYLQWHEQEVRTALGPHRPDLTIWRHPTQLYEALAVLLLAWGLWYWWRRSGERRPGLQTGWTLAGYGLWRCFNESLRADNPILIGSWSASQCLSLLLMVLGLGLIVRSTRRSSAGVGEVGPDEQR